MNTKNLSTVTTDVIESYGNAAKNVIDAYRLGNQRVARFVDQRWESAVQQASSRLRAEARTNALSAQKAVNGMYVKGIDMTSAGAGKVVDKFVEIAGKGVHQVACNAKAFETRTGVTTLNTIAKAAVPAVVVVGDLASKLEQGSNLLANTVGGNTAVADTIAKVKKQVAKRTAPARKSAPRKARKTA